MNALTSAEPMTYPATVPSSELATMEPKPMPWPPPDIERSMVPGWRSSERVAEVARAAASLDRGASPCGAFLLSSANSSSRCSGVSFEKASRCTLSIVSGGAVRSR
jgi:hypothetical protein